MNREIKFRAWDSVEKIMIYFDLYDIEKPNVLGGQVPYTRGDGAEVYFSTWRQPLMQYTGLKDKNGKEIFEGDIVVKDGYIWFTDEGRPNYRGTVEWYYSSWNVSVTSVNPDNLGSATGQGFNDDGLDEGSTTEWEVIGNIHENPELLA